MKVKATRARPQIEVTTDAKGIVSHAGLGLLAEAVGMVREELHVWLDADSGEAALREPNVRPLEMGGRPARASC